VGEHLRADPAEPAPAEADADEAHVVRRLVRAVVTPRQDPGGLVVRVAQDVGVGSEPEEALAVRFPEEAVGGARQPVRRRLRRDCPVGEDAGVRVNVVEVPGLVGAAEEEPREDTAVFPGVLVDGDKAFDRQATRTSEVELTPMYGGVGDERRPADSGIDMPEGWGELPVE
jgi:hypothetical protein